MGTPRPNGNYESNLYYQMVKDLKQNHVMYIRNKQTVMGMVAIDPKVHYTYDKDDGMYTLTYKGNKQYA